MRLRIHTAFTALALLVALPLASPAADSQTSGVTLSGMRSWSSPTGTRVVIDFSAPVDVVAPDSGASRQLVVTVPGQVIARGSAVPLVLGVRDGVIDSVEVVEMAFGAQFRFAFRAVSPFHVFRLPAEADKPFRLVADVQRPGAAVAEEKRAANIVATKKRERVRIVAVDAGHGGEDAGARGPGGVLEKNVTLGVAKALVDELNEIPGLRAELTRNGDYFIPLRQRYHAAEKMKADLFVSIHANSSKRRGRGSGTEVYFLSLRGASDQADADLADVENAADLVGGVPQQAEDDLVNILYDVKRASALQQSQLLASTLLDHLAADRRLESRGVKQAGFVVLKSVEFPSVLVETAFINNPVEAKLLRSPEFQKQMARQLANGVKTYFQKAGIGVAVPDGEAQSQSLR